MNDLKNFNSRRDTLSCSEVNGETAASRANADKTNQTNQKIYLDNAATTKPDSEILAAAVSYAENGGFYNPSALYKCGRFAKSELEKARAEILSFFPSGYELVFTSCGSEADEQAIFSFAKHGNAVTSVGEHAAVINSFSVLKQNGTEVRLAPLTEGGAVNADELLKLVDDKTAFVSVMHVNNETGAINDVSAIAKAVKAKNPRVIFHSDGVQAFLKIPQKISSYVDLYSVSAHKICALKGVGALVYKKGLALKPVIYGGGQEKGLRSGTENTFGIKVFADCAKKYADVKQNYECALNLKNLFLSERSPDIKVISPENSAPYVISISGAGVKGEIMQRVLDDEGLIVGTGSACSSKIGVSRVISACVKDGKIAQGALRISLIFTTTEDEIVYCARKINECYLKLKGKLL